MLWLHLLVFFTFFPCKLYLFFLIASLYLSVYKFIYYKDFHKPLHDIELEFWDYPMKQVSKVFYFFGRLFYAYETELEKIPDKGAAVIVSYHGLTTCDFGCLFSKVFLEKNRRIHIIIHNGIFNVPGIKTALTAFGAVNRDPERCIDLLNKGELIAMFPGGAREFFLSDDNYSLVWDNHKGFAKVSQKARCKIIPVFTKNTRAIHGLNAIDQCRKQFDKYKWLYSFILWGWFPVKFTTYIADPVEYDEDRTIDQLFEMTKKAVENLIEKHQKKPGSIFQGLQERFQIIKDQTFL